MTLDKLREPHVIRRFIHINQVWYPILFYYFLNRFPNNQDRIYIVVAGITALILVLEIIRLFLKLKIFGQRDHEKEHISSFAWAALAMSLVFFFCPQIGIAGAALGLPLIWSMALIDPVIGEMRIRKYNTWAIGLMGLILTYFIWLASSIVLKTPWFFATILPPIIIFSESIRSRWIDDNALMLLLPLAVIYILQTLAL